MRRTYQYVSDFAVVLFTTPNDIEEEAVADAWASMFLDAVVKNPQEFHLDDVYEGEETDVY